MGLSPLLTAMATVAQLTAAHPLHKAFSSQWRLLTRLIEGGTSVTLADKQRLLRHPDNRPEALKEKRAEVAHLSPILGGLIVKLQSQIMRVPGVYEPNLAGTTRPSDDPFWANFIQSAAQDADDTFSLHQSLSKSLLQALTTGVSYIQVDTPPTPEARTRAEQSELGGDEPFLILRDRADVLDWDRDRHGFKFAKIHTQGYERESWDSTLVPFHQYQIYQRSPEGRVTSQTWKITPKAKNVEQFEPTTADIVEQVSEEQEIFYTTVGGTDLFQFPIIPLSIPQELVVGAQLYETYVQLFTQTAGINYASLVSLWRQLVFSDVNDPADIQARIGTGAGDGFFWALPPGVVASWLETDTGGLEFALKYGEHLKGEMLEQISQIAASAAASYAGMNRSGESKKEDRRNLDILLESYGMAVKGTVKRVLDCAAVARGEDILDWNVHGFNKYDSDGLLDDLAEYLASAPVVNSPTFTVEGRKAIAAEAVTALGLPQSSLSVILAEIEADGQGSEAMVQSEDGDSETPS